MKERYFATLFDKNYLAKGLAMIKSLCRNCDSAIVYVLCMDDYTRHVVESQFSDNIFTVSLSQVETPQVLSAKENRTIAEYCWTLSSVFTWYVLDSFDHIDLLTYLDSDIYFYCELLLPGF